MEKRKKKIAEAPEGREYIWVKDPVLSGKSNPDGGFIRLNKESAIDYQFGELKMIRTGRLRTYEGKRCIFVDMPVFEQKMQGDGG